MLSQDDRPLGLAPLDSVGTSLNRLKGHLGLVTLKGHQLIYPFDYLFLNGENRGIKVAGKSCPRDTLPNNCSAAITRDRLKIVIHQSSEGDCSTVPRSPLKRGNGGTVWTLLSVVFRGIARNSCGTAEQLDIYFSFNCDQCVIAISAVSNQ